MKKILFVCMAIGVMMFVGCQKSNQRKYPDGKIVTMNADTNEPVE